MSLAPSICSDVEKVTVCGGWNQFHLDMGDSLGKFIEFSLYESWNTKKT
jgi:hypothetical protein